MTVATQVEAYVRHTTVDEVLTLDEIFSRASIGAAGSNLGVEPAASGRGRWLVAVAAIVALVVGVAVLFGSEPDVEPAELVPIPVEGEPGAYFLPQDIPEGFFLQSVLFDPIGRWSSSVMFRREVDGDTWLPSDGAFAVDAQSTFFDPEPDRGSPAVAEQRLDQVNGLIPEAVEVRVGDERAVLHETAVTQGAVQTNRVSLLVHDGAGALFEVTALGLTVNEVMDIAATVVAASASDMEAVGLRVPWTHQIFVTHQSFAFEVPEVLREVSDDYTIMLGVDLLQPRLLQQFRWNGPGPVIASESESGRGQIFLTARTSFAEGQVHSALSADAAISLVLLAQETSNRHVERLVLHAVEGTVLQTEPLIVQAPPGPAPQFDTSALGEEIPLVPVGADAIPAFLLNQLDPLPGGTSESLPVTILGQAQPEDRLDGSPTLAIWNDQGAFCTASIAEGPSSGTGISCGGGVAFYGLTAATSGGTNDITYVVPADTAVVQILTSDATYWQRPIVGFGIIPYGHTIKRPQEIIAFDVDGEELGRWNVDAP